MKYTWVAIGLAVLAAGAGCAFLFSSSAPKGGGGLPFGASAAFGTTTATSSSAVSGNRYTITPYGTSFTKPAGWTAKQVKNGTRTVVTVMPKASQGTGGVQIAITPVGESMPVITPARIHQDLPNLDIENPKHVMVDGQDILIFTSHNASYGGSEAWFVHSGALYQISALPDSKNTFTTLVASLHF